MNTGRFQFRSRSSERLSALLVLFLFLATLAPTGTAQPLAAGQPNIADLQRQFQAPPDDAKIMMRWWWFGPAVTKPELERELRIMKAGGIGGVEIQPVYPLALDETVARIKTLPFLSDEFIDALRFTADKARELGLRIDLTIGSGWPSGGAQVPISEAAGRLRVERVKIAANTKRVPLPDIGAGEKLLAIFLARNQGKTIAAESIRELTEIKDGAVVIPPGSNGDEVLFFFASRTGMQVKRAAVGAEGFVLDHYNRTALDHYLKNTGDRLMQAFGDQPPFAIFCDSLEVFGSDWTDDLLAEFQRRRGYDLKPHLPALVADIGPPTAAIRHDWGMTLTELLNERFLAPMQNWAQQNHTKFRLQGYGIPPATISSNAYADLPEGEGPQWKTLRASRWASSASHLFGRPVTSSETWTWLHSPVFRATPLDVKAEADLHFLQGINQLIGHGWPYTPEGVEYPGWRFYAAGVFNEKNPWWIVMPDLSLYLQRLSFLLRQGQPANDVALYLPNSDAWAGFTSGKVHYLIEALKERIGDKVVAETLEAGYNFDFFDDGVLKQLGSVDKNMLVLGTNKYRVVILPNVERMQLDTLRRLEEFARNGGIVIATRRRPAIAPGFKATDSEQQQVHDISQRLFEGSSAPAYFIEDENRQLGNKLTSLLRPDVALSPVVPEIGFIHRRTASAEIYFLANTSNKPQKVKASFRVSGMNAELWNPLTGTISSVEVQIQSAESLSIPLEFEPYASRVVVFSKRTLARPSVNTARAVPPPMDLSRDWRVLFGQQGKAVTMDRLQSWAENEETRYFSGEVTYEKEVTVPAAMLQSGCELHLDFGEGQPVTPQNLKAGMQAWLDAPIREAAVVYLNERRVGSIWCPPFAVNVTGLLTPGQNHLRIVVGNTALNYLAGRRLPDYKLLNLRYGVRFEAQDMDKVQVIPSGLLGPIRLLTR